MYSLREVGRAQNYDNAKSDQRIMNFFLGKRYSFINKDSNEADFNGAFSAVYSYHPKANDLPCKPDDLEVVIGGFVSDEDGKLYPLDRRNQYYIVMPNGQTFEKLFI